MCDLLVLLCPTACSKMAVTVQLVSVLDGKDKTLLAYAKSVEKLVKVARMRGAFGGSMCSFSYVYNSTTPYYNV